MRAWLLSLVALCLASPWAHAQPHSDLFWIPAPAGPRITAGSNVIFLNNCLPSGCMLQPGPNDSRTNTSTIVSQPSLLAAWRFSAGEWDNLVTCVREVFAPFEVQVVTTEPASTSEYFEAMVAGSPQQLGLPMGYAGLSPFTCGVIDNAITFTFANDTPYLNPTAAGTLCWTVAQEIAHAFGLQHKYDSRDPMTYLDPALPIKLFVDDEGPCGTQAARDCRRGDQYELFGCPSAPATTNSYARLAALFGAKPATAPTLEVAQPTEGATVSRGFAVRATASDDVRLRDVALSLDDTPLPPALRVGPFEWRAPKLLAEGTHQLTVVATDYYGAATTVTRSITVRPDCSGNATGCDSGQLCIEGRCVDGPDREGGLGDACEENAECSSGTCATRGSAQACAEDCTLGARSCPDGFSCVEGGDSGLCWPNAEGGCASCGSSPSNSAGSSGGGAPLAAGLGFALLAVLRRRARRPAVPPAATSP